MTAYYNENDPFAAAWLRNLIAANLIAQGEVDERSIADVRPDDLAGFTQHHFFAGIGGWSYALRLAGWPDNRPVWTGSCPCQPFSVAGKQKAQSDTRHLWPEWFRLIAICKPPVIFGEQVTGAIAHGWFDDVAERLESQSYAIGAAIIPACGVGAPHKRDRLWFVAHSNIARLQGWKCTELSECTSEQFIGESDSSLADPQKCGRLQGSTDTGRVSKESGATKERLRSSNSSDILADTSSGSAQSSSAQCHERGLQETFLRESRHSHDWNVEPSVGRVANGISARSHKLRAYGNAIVPQVAQAFIEAYLEVA